ncbi:NADPH-dependent FMN reductase [Microbacterium sp. gxy059]|uniref:NADPH-dependent FMN reductase n=1 Tax=Microbacterium sp. gxy059 TaxID=2957199 RepID=UPI003D992D8A
MRIGIIIGSVRDGRKGESVARWVLERARQRDGAEVALIDLREFDLPLLSSPVVPMAAKGEYDSPAVSRWADAIGACDAFVFVTPEYNHSVPGAFKNAIDSIGVEWVRKPVAFVSYGAAGGIRAVEHWRQIVANFHMFDVRAQVAFDTASEFEGAEVEASPRRENELGTLLTQLIDITTTPRG